MNARMFLMPLLGLAIMFGVTTMPALSAMAADLTRITVCIVDVEAKKNPHYNGLATTLTRLNCEIPGTQGKMVTLGSLYQNGWRLIQVVGEGWLRPTGGQKAHSPIYYLEKTFDQPAAAKTN